MNIEKVSYQKTFNLGNYSSERIGVDVNINAGEDAMEAIEVARKLVNENFEKNNPHLVTPDIPIIPKHLEGYAKGNFNVSGNDERVDLLNSYVKDKKAQLPLLVDQIKSVTDLKVLESYKFIVKGKPELQTIYDNKLNELSHE
jgi:hypothetical protein